MKTWFSGDSEGRIKRGGGRKGTLSDELSKADRIGKQLRYNEAELNQLEKAEEQKQQKHQEVEEKQRKQLEQVKEEQIIAPVVEVKPKREPIQMSSPFPVRRQPIEEVVPEPKKEQMIQPTNDNEPPAPWYRQTLKPEHKIKYAAKDTAEVAKTIIEAAPKEMEVTHVTALNESPSYTYGDHYEEESYEASYEEPYEAVCEETCEAAYGIQYEEEIKKEVREAKEEIREEHYVEPQKSTVKLKSDITITFGPQDTVFLNSNIAAVITLLNSSGEQFDFKITNDGKGGQNLNVIAPSSIIRQILMLFE